MKCACHRTYTAIHAGRMGQHQAVHGLIGDDEDDNIVEGFLDMYTPRQKGAVQELQAHSTVQEVGVQGLLHQLDCVPTGRPAETWGTVTLNANNINNAWKKSSITTYT